MKKITVHPIVLANHKLFGFRLMLKSQALNESVATSIIKLAEGEPTTEDTIYLRNVNISKDMYITFLYQKVLATGKLIGTDEGVLREVNEFGHIGRPLYITLGLLCESNFDIKRISQDKFKKIITQITPYYKSFYYSDNPKEIFSIKPLELEINQMEADLNLEIIHKLSCEVENFHWVMDKEDPIVKSPEVQPKLPKDPEYIPKNDKLLNTKNIFGSLITFTGLGLMVYSGGITLFNTLVTGTGILILASKNKTSDISDNYK